MKAVGLLAGAICVGAGVWLLTQQSVEDPTVGTSWFEIIAHGIGVYFIGKGIFVAALLWARDDAAKVEREQLNALLAIAQQRRGQEGDV